MPTGSFRNISVHFEAVLSFFLLLTVTCIVRGNATRSVSSAACGAAVLVTVRRIRLVSEFSPGRC